MRTPLSKHVRSDNVLEKMETKCTLVLKIKKKIQLKFLCGENKI